LICIIFLNYVTRKTALQTIANVKINMALLSKSEFCGFYMISRPTLDRWLSSGRLSSTQDGSGRVKIDSAEATRLAIQSRNRAPVVQEATATVASVRIEALEQRLRDREAELERALESAEHWRAELTRSSAVLTDQRDAATKEADAARNKAAELAEMQRKESDARRKQRHKIEQLAFSFEERAKADKTARDILEAKLKKARSLAIEKEMAEAAVGLAKESVEQKAAKVQAELEAQLSEARSQQLEAEMEHNAVLEAKSAADKAAAQAKAALDFETNRGFWQRIFG